MWFFHHDEKNTFYIWEEYKKQEQVFFALYIRRNAQLGRSADLKIWPKIIPLQDV